MGSITKVMTAYVVIEAGNLNQLITVPDGITAYDKEFGASTAGLKPGEQLTVEDLLYAMLVPSGCDAAYTLAQAYGPGLSGFIDKMNATAAQLGLTGRPPTRLSATTPGAIGIKTGDTQAAGDSCCSKPCRTW